MSARYFLMHQDIVVAELDMRFGVCDQLLVVAPEHMPLAAADGTARSLNRWLQDRIISPERQGLAAIERALGSSVDAAAVKALQVSLTDCYWVKSLHSPLVWRDVNYHDNGFCEDFAPLVFAGRDITIQDFRLPDLTTNGCLAKAWYHQDSVPVLLKRGYFVQEDRGSVLAANEVAASIVAGLYGFSHVQYVPVTVQNTGEILCASECIIQSPDIEMVSAKQIAKSHRLYGEALFRWFCENGFEKEVKDMVFFDHVLYNDDRHEDNFALFRDPATLTFSGFAPLFDSGSCLDWNYSSDTKRDIQDTKPFCIDRRSQLGLLSRDDIDTRNTVSPAMIKSVLADVYSQFHIPKKQLQIAQQCVDDSFAMLNKQKNRHVAPSGRAEEAR